MTPDQLTELLTNIDSWGGVACGLLMSLIVAVTWKG